MAFIAEFKSDCALCDDPIEEGQVARMTYDGAAHDRCHAQEDKRVWACLVRGRAYSNPQFFCMSMAGMKEEHKKAGCGVYEKARR